MAIKKVNLTSQKLSGLICEKGKSQSIYRCAKTPCLGIRVTPSNQKSFIFESSFNGKTIRMTIGDIKTWTISDAQAEARNLKVMVDKGIDPRQQKATVLAKAETDRFKAEKACVIWAEYVADRKHQWGERHLSDHLDMARDEGGLITRGLRQGQSNIKKAGILRDVLSLPLNDITREVVLSWVKREVKTRPARARIALSALKAFITWAGDNQKYKSVVNLDACDRVSRELPAKKAKTDCLQREQLEVWFAAVKKISNPVISAYLQILLITGARRNELSSLKWADVDLRWNAAVIKDKVDGTRQIPITPYVSMLIKSLPKRNQYVFSSSVNEKSHITEPRKAHQLAMQSAGIEDLSLHGLRRSFGTLSDWIQCPEGIKAQIQGHKPTAIAEKHYRVRAVDMLRGWHVKIEKFMLDEAKIKQPEFSDITLRIVNGNV
jgi:integrase